MAHAGRGHLAYFQYALHQLPDPVAALRAAYASLRAGGWLVALDWYLPTDPDELLSHATASCSPACSSTSWSAARAS